MAEYLLRNRLGPDSSWTVSSAGLMAGFASPPSRNGVVVMDDLGIDIRAHESRQLDRELVDEASLIVVMTRSHADQVELLYPDAGAKVYLLNSFGGAGLKDVDDPIGATVDVYRNVRDEINKAIDGLISFINKIDSGDRKKR